jgi:hypothetical protein
VDCLFCLMHALAATDIESLMVPPYDLANDIVNGLSDDEVCEWSNRIGPLKLHQRLLWKIGYLRPPNHENPVQDRIFQGFLVKFWPYSCLEIGFLGAIWLGRVNLQQNFNVSANQT